MVAVITARVTRHLVRVICIGDRPLEYRKRVNSPIMPHRAAPKATYNIPILADSMFSEVAIVYR